MAINQVRPDTPLANTPDIRFAQDTISKKTSTYAEKRAAQEIVKQKNREARENVLNRNAAARNMTRAEVRVQQDKDKKKPNQPCGDFNDPNFDATKCPKARAAAKLDRKAFRSK